jgi:hypothetical protein
MIRSTILLLIIAFVFIGCETKKKEFDFQAAIPDDAFFFSNFQYPDTVAKNYKHEDTRMIDLDNDWIPELNIVSLLDTTVTDSVIRILKITRSEEKESKVYISMLVDQAPPAPAPYANGTGVKVENELLYVLHNGFYLCRSFEDLSTGKDSTDGVWNAMNQRSFVVKFTTGGQNYGSWVQIDVKDYDQYLFYNYATFKLD